MVKICANIYIFNFLWTYNNHVLKAMEFLEENIY